MPRFAFPKRECCGKGIATRQRRKNGTACKSRIELDDPVEAIYAPDDLKIDGVPETPSLTESLRQLMQLLVGTDRTATVETPAARRRRRAEVATRRPSLSKTASTVNSCPLIACWNTPSRPCRAWNMVSSRASMTPFPPRPWRGLKNAGATFGLGCDRQRRIQTSALEPALVDAIQQDSPAPTPRSSPCDAAGSLSQPSAIASSSSSIKGRKISTSASRAAEKGEIAPANQPTEQGETRRNTPDPAAPFQRRRRGRSRSDRANAGDARPIPRPGEPAALIITRMSMRAREAVDSPDQSDRSGDRCPRGICTHQNPVARRPIIEARFASFTSARKVIGPEFNQCCTPSDHDLRPPPAAAKQRVNGVVDSCISSVPVEADLPDRKLSRTNDEQVASSRSEPGSKPLPMLLQGDLVRVDCLPPHLGVIHPVEIQQHVVGSRRPQSKQLYGRWIEILGEPHRAKAVHCQFAAARKLDQGLRFANAFPQLRWRKLRVAPGRDARDTVSGARPRAPGRSAPGSRQCLSTRLGRPRHRRSQVVAPPAPIARSACAIRSARCDRWPYDRGARSRGDRSVPGARDARCWGQ